MTGSSRDTQFELDIAALLFRAKINALRFDARHDLVCSLLHNPLIIECKRPRKNKTLRDLYASGAHQIESSPLIKENPDTKGIVALDLTQVISPSLKGSRYNSINEMQNAFTQAFVKKWGRLQITISDYSDRVSALHLFCGGPSYLENRRFLRSFSDSAEPHRYQHKRLKKKPQNRIHISRFFNARQQHILDDLKKRRVKFRSLRKQSTLKGPQFSRQSRFEMFWPESIRLRHGGDQEFEETAGDHVGACRRRRRRGPSLGGRRGCSSSGFNSIFIILGLK